MTNELPERYREILNILISDYIASAVPVGSQVISRRSSQQLSSATVRNVLADLTAMGLLIQPHTSAGRVPTSQGLRYYVDSLLKTHDLTEEERSAIRERCGNVDGGVQHFLQRASGMLSVISRYVGLVAMPGEEEINFKHIEFLKLSRGKLLGIFVAQSGQVVNHLIDVDEDFTYADLEKINNVCHRAFLGLNLAEARAKIAAELETQRQEMDRRMRKAFEFADGLLRAVPAGEVMMEGESQLMACPEFAAADRFRELLTALEEKQRILKLLDRMRQADGVKVFIGAESEEAAPWSTSVVSAPYRKNGRVVGMLGVIGPQRMDYSHVVPVVDFTAKLVGDYLESTG